MNLKALARPGILAQPVYEPGKPIEDVARELGLDPSAIIKLASNENPFGPSPLAIEAAKRALAQGQLYPDGACLALREKLAGCHGLAPDQIICGNGSNEVIELVCHAFLGPEDNAVMGEMAFVVYKLVTLVFGAKAIEVPLVQFRHDLAAMARAVTPNTRIVFVASPNNPTGATNSEADLLAFARSLPDHVVMVYDEAYADFVEKAPDLRPLIAAGRKVICLRTFSKIYGLASLRVGYGYSSAEMVELLNRVRQPFNVNAIGQAAALAALDDVEFVADCARRNRLGLAQLEAGFRRLGLEFVPSSANFILVRVGDGARCFQELQLRGVIVRPLQVYRLPEWVRITVGTPAQNGKLLEALSQTLSR
jgi:histidinol-phosphate aminotransferase